MHESFDSRGLQSVSVVLLTCKMTATFIHNAFSAGNMDTISQVANISAEEIRDAIIALGFGCRSLSSRETGSGDMSKDSFSRPM